MQLKKHFRRITAELRHRTNKWQTLFKATHFDRILAKQLSNEENNFYKDLGLAEGMIKSYMIAHVKNIKSQRDAQRLVRDDAMWRQISTFQDDVPDQSTFSRHWNDPAYLNVLDTSFTTLQKLIGHKKVHLDQEYPIHQVKALQKGYLPLSTDATFIALSNKRFRYATLGYAGKEKTTDFGARINVIIECLLNMPFNYIPTSADVHETRSIDALIDDLLTYGHPWLKTLGRQGLKALLILDRGYWNKKRFVEWLKHSIEFIIPRKRKSLTRNMIEFLDFPSSKYDPLEGLVWLDPLQAPLRWIVYPNYARKGKYWDLLTSITDLDTRSVIKLQKNRWPIEEVFKWLKQHLDLERPLTESWTGFLIHCYIIFLLFLLLFYFLSLLAIPKWQENLTELNRQLREHPSTNWDIHRLKVPLSFLIGGEN